MLHLIHFHYFSGQLTVDVLFVPLLIKVPEAQSPHQSYCCMRSVTGDWLCFCFSLPSQTSFEDIPGCLHVRL